MGAIDDNLADELIAHQLDVLRFEAGLRTRVFALLERLQKELVQKLKSEDLTEFTKARTTALLRDTSQLIDEYYTRITADVNAQLNGLVPVEARATKEVFETVIISMQAQLPTKAFMERLVSNSMIFGSPSAEWWMKQSQDTAFQFANAVRQGLAQGETTSQIVNRITGTDTISGVMEVSKKNARSLVQTSVQTVANEARFETFRQNKDIIRGVQQLSTLDGRTTDICIAYSGAEWDLSGKPLRGTRLAFNGGPPRHWNCRSVLVPLTRTFKELGLDIPEPEPRERASADGPVAASTTFDAFLTRRGTAFQDEVLGPGRAELWRSGTITLSQLLDLKGNPLTLRQLRDRFETA